MSAKSLFSYLIARKLNLDKRETLAKAESEEQMTVKYTWLPVCVSCVLSGRCEPHLKKAEPHSLKQRKRDPRRLNGLSVLPLQHMHAFCGLKY